MSTSLHPRYITDEGGKRISVVLPIDEYEALTERLEDLEDLAEAREAVANVERGSEETIPWPAIKAEHGL